MTRLMAPSRVAVVGAGPAGLTCAASTAAAGLPTTIFERSAPGGQLNLLAAVRLFDGGPMRDGPDIGAELTDYAMDAGVEFCYEDVTAVARSGEAWLVQTSQQQEFDELVIACGSDPDLSMIPRVADLMGRGLSLCAACDGPLFKDRDVAVVGCGRDAVYEVRELLTYVRSVIVVPVGARRELLWHEFDADARVTVLPTARILDCVGAPLRAMTVVDADGATAEVPISGLFPASARCSSAPRLGAPAVTGAATLIGDARPDTAATILAAIGDGSRTAAAIIDRQP